MADKRRIKRLENVILQAVAPMVAHGLTDPRLSMVTVTRIRLSPDLSVARVNWSCMGSEADRSKAAHALEAARGVLQGAVAKAMQTRTTPRLHFHFDESLAKALRVTEILEDLARERAAREGPAEEDADEPAGEDE
jgi:ribosome-binding factor A